MVTMNRQKSRESHANNGKVVPPLSDYDPRIVNLARNIFQLPNVSQSLHPLFSMANTAENSFHRIDPNSNNLGYTSSSSSNGSTSNTNFWNPSVPPPNYRYRTNTNINNQDARKYSPGFSTPSPQQMSPSQFHTYYGYGNRYPTSPEYYAGQANSIRYPPPGFPTFPIYRPKPVYVPPSRRTSPLPRLSPNERAPFMQQQSTKTEEQKAKKTHFRPPNHSFVPPPLPADYKELPFHSPSHGLRVLANCFPPPRYLPAPPFQKEESQPKSVNSKEKLRSNVLSPNEYRYKYTPQNKNLTQIYKTQLSESEDSPRDELQIPQNKFTGDETVFFDTTKIPASSEPLCSSHGFHEIMMEKYKRSVDAHAKQFKTNNHEFKKLDPDIFDCNYASFLDANGPMIPINARYELNLQQNPWHNDGIECFDHDESPWATENAMNIKYLPRRSRFGGVKWDDSKNIN